MKTALNALAPFLPDRLALARTHRWHHGKLRLFFFPRTFSEFIERTKLGRDNALRTLTADKIAVRDFVRERIGERYLIPMLAVLNGPEDLDPEALPASFILKAAHGSGMNLIVRNGDASFDELRSEILRWLRTDFSAGMRERHYEKIPRRVLVEELLLDEQEQPPADYKFFVFRGRVALIQVDRGRFSDHTRDLFTPDWRELAVTLSYRRSESSMDVPEMLGEMISVAEKLAEPFVFARIDLYLHHGRVYFGEITHTPGGAAERFDPPEFDRDLGSIWRRGGSIPSRYLAQRPGEKELGTPCS